MTSTYYPKHAGEWQTYVNEHGGNPISVLLCAGYIPDPAHEFVDDITGEITTGSVTRVALSGVTVSTVGDTRLVGYANDVTIPTCTFTGATAFVIYVNTGSDATSPLIRATTFAPTNNTASPFQIAFNSGILFDYDPDAPEISSVAGVTPDSGGDIPGSDLAEALGLIPAGGTGSIVFGPLVGDADYSGNGFTDLDILNADGTTNTTFARSLLGGTPLRVLVYAGDDICKVFDVTATTCELVTTMLGGQIADSPQVGSFAGVQMQAKNTLGPFGQNDPEADGTSLVWQNEPAALVRPRVIFSRLHIGDGVAEDIDPTTKALNFSLDGTDWTWSDPDNNSVAATNSPIIDGIAYRGGTILIMGQPSEDENGPWVPIYDEGAQTWSAVRPTALNGVVDPSVIAEGEAFWVGSGVRFNNSVWTPSWSGTIAPGPGSLNPEYVTINHLTGTAATDGQVLVRDEASDRGYKWDTVAGGSGSVATDTIFDAKGDLAVGTGSNTAAKLSVGANDTIPVADSAETTGIKWAAPSAVRTALGLGGAATLAVGTTAGTVAAGDDSRITGAAAKANNLSDLASASTARTNLGVAIGTDVQAYSALLAALVAGSLTAAQADSTKVPYGSLTFSCLAAPTASQNTWIVSTSGALTPHTTQTSSPVVNDYIEWARIPLGGTYTIGLIYQAGTTAPKIRIAIDGTNVSGLIDTYNGSSIIARDVSTTGVVIAPGLHTLRLTAEAVGSGAYQARPVAVTFTRTA